MTERANICPATTLWYGREFQCAVPPHSPDLEHIAELNIAGTGRSAGTLTWLEDPTDSDQQLADVQHADGSRSLLPAELSHLTPTTARAYWRGLLGSPVETREEAAHAARTLDLARGGVRARR